MYNWLIAILAGGAYGILGGRGNPRLYQLMFWLFVYVFLGLAPLVQLRRGVEPTTTPGALSRLSITTEVVILVSLLAFLLGGLLFRHHQSQNSKSELQLNPRSVYMATALSTLFALYYISKIGVSYLLASREQLAGRQVTVWPDPTTSALFVAAGTMSLLISVSALVQLRRTHRTTANALALWFSVGLLLIAANPISSPRYVFGTVALSLAAIAGAFSSRHRFRIAALVVVASMLLIFPYADRFRSGVAGGITAKGGPTSTLTSGDFDAFAQIQNAVELVATHGSTHGRQALGVLLFWVPRGIWNDKPQDTGILIAESQGYHFTNLSAPLWSELMINGGWMALVAGMVGFGCLIRRLDDAQSWMNRQGGVLATILPFYMIILLRGSLLQATLRLAVLISMTYLVRRCGQYLPASAPEGSEDTTTPGSLNNEYPQYSNGSAHALTTQKA